MSEVHQRVIAALERREPDRVPTMDVMVEYGNIMEILGRRPVPLKPFFDNRASARAIDFLASRAFSSLPVDIAMDAFARDRTEAAVRMGYDSAWVQHAPSWNGGDSKTVIDVFGRRFNLAFDEAGNLLSPMYSGGLIDGPDAWSSWDKRGAMRLPAKNLKAYARIQRELGDDIFVFGSFCGGLFEITWQCMGFDSFAMATRRNRGLLDRMILFYTDLYCLILEAMASAGLPGAVYSDDLAYRSGPMLNPELLDSR